MDAVTLVVVALLVAAASLASYLLSQWSLLRSSDRRLGWAAVAGGTAMLMAAAAIVVLTMGWVPTLRLVGNEPKQAMLRSAVVGQQTAKPVRDPQKATKNRSDKTPSATTGRDDRVVADRGSADSGSSDRSQVETSSSTAWVSPSPSASSVITFEFAAENPWAATSCVHAFNPDPGEPTRWTVDNGCGVPVGIVISSCSQSLPECNDSQSQSWQYPIDGMILPGKGQRPVRVEEETQQGRQIRYVACFVATPLARQLIGQSSEVRSSPSWLEALAAARQSDGCLKLVQSRSDAGHRSKIALVALLGTGAPIKVRPDSATEP